jgi:ATP-dependent Lhr-like helicase
LSWPVSPGRPARAAGAYVVVVGGRCAAYLERGGRSLITFGVEAEAYADALASLQKEGRVRRLVIERINGCPAIDSEEMIAAFRAAGFSDSYRGLVLRG